MRRGVSGYIAFGTLEIIERKTLRCATSHDIGLGPRSGDFRVLSYHSTFGPFQVFSSLLTSFTITPHPDRFIMADNTDALAPRVCSPPHPHPIPESSKISWACRTWADQALLSFLYRRRRSMPTLNPLSSLQSRSTLKH